MKKIALGGHWCDLGAAELGPIRDRAIWVRYPSQDMNGLREDSDIAFGGPAV